MKTCNKRLPYNVFLVLISIILTIALISTYFKGDAINISLFTAITNIFLFLATVALAFIAYIQLKALREQANADFLLKFNRDFFNNEVTRKIIPLIEENRPILKRNSGIFSEYDLDDYLGYYELMSWYEEKGIIDFDLIDETFGHYISLAWQNKEIKEYIDELRETTKDQRYYKPFETLANRIIEIEKGFRKF
jgi:hypothetical protein